MADQPLKGVGVLVTRPREQAGELVALLEANGADIVHFPVLDILPREAATIAAEAGALATPDIVIFISQNAVAYGLAHAGQGRIAAVGPATAAAIEQQGRKVDILPPTGFDSESLLAEAQLHDVKGKTIRIVRGDAGRELLATTLRERGARVEYLSVYERALPHCSAQLLAEVETAWRAGDLKVVTVMSVQSLHNLVRLLPEACRERLHQLALVTPSARVIQEALNYASKARPVLASGPQAAQMLDAIIASQTPDSGSST